MALAWILAMLVAWPVWASSIDTVVRIESKLYAKLIFLDYEVEKKLIDGKVRIVVLYDTPEHRQIARRFVQALDGMALFHHAVEATATEQARWKGRVADATAYIAVLAPASLQKVYGRIVEGGRLLFGYFPDQPDFVTISITIGSRVVPVVNARLLKRSGIQMRPILFKVAKVAHAD
jgi:hypothetical protein